LKEYIARKERGKEVRVSEEADTIEKYSRQKEEGAFIRTTKKGVECAV